MRIKASRSMLLLAVLFVSGCAKLPEGAEQVVMGLFDPGEEPRLHSAHRAELLEGDVIAGVTEIWCINIDHKFPLADLSFADRVSGYMAYLVAGEWEVTRMTSEEDWEEWNSRDCPTPLGDYFPRLTGASTR